MSVNHLDKIPKAHSIHDDVESCFWVFVYIAIHYFSGQLVVAQDSDHCNLFEERTPCEETEGYQGGLCKREFLMSGFATDQITFDSEPLTRVLRGFAEVLSQYYERFDANTGTAARAPPIGAVRRRIQAIKKLGNVKEIIRIFDDALNSQDWPERDDATQDQWPKSQVLGVNSTGWKSACKALHAKLPKRRHVPKATKKKASTGVRPEEREPEAKKPAKPRKTTARKTPKTLNKKRERSEEEESDTCEQLKEGPPLQKKRKTSAQDRLSTERKQYQTRLRSREQKKARAGPVTRARAKRDAL